MRNLLPGGVRHAELEERGVFATIGDVEGKQGQQLSSLPPIPIHVPKGPGGDGYRSPTAFLTDARGGYYLFSSIVPLVKKRLLHEPPPSTVGMSWR